VPVPTLTLVDNTTGDVVWQQEVACVNGVASWYFGLAVSDDAVVYAASATTNGNRCGYGAFDLDTGHRLWEVEPTHASLEVAITIADGAAFIHGLTSFTSLQPVFAVVRMSDGQILFSTDSPQGSSTGTPRVAVANEMFFLRGSAWRFGDVIIPY
jgi:outer membrane protein assembly factor BamB